MQIDSSTWRQFAVWTLVSGMLVSGCGARSASPPVTTVPSSTSAPSTIVSSTVAPSVVTTGVATTVVVGTTAVVTTTAATSTTTAPGAATSVAAITANWERFFLPTTSIDDRVALLENGSALRQALQQRATDPLQAQASAKVKQVELTAPDRATVTYDVSLNDAVALPDAQGTAVLEGGVWKVGAESFCALISLGATAPIPGCS